MRGRGHTPAYFITLYRHINVRPVSDSPNLFLLATPGGSRRRTRSSQGKGLTALARGSVSRFWAYHDGCYGGPDGLVLRLLHDLLHHAVAERRTLP